MADREERDSAQKAKFIFLSVAGLVAVLLLTSFVVANRARSARDAALRDLDACKQDNAKLTQYIDEQTREIDKLKKQATAVKAKAKARPSAKSKSAKGKAAPKKKTTRNR